MGVHTQTEQWLNNCIDYLKKKNWQCFLLKKEKKKMKFRMSKKNSLTWNTALRYRVFFFSSSTGSALIDLRKDYF